MPVHPDSVNPRFIKGLLYVRLQKTVLALKELSLYWGSGSPREPQPRVEEAPVTSSDGSDYTSSVTWP